MHYFLNRLPRLLVLVAALALPLLLLFKIAGGAAAPPRMVPAGAPPAALNLAQPSHAGSRATAVAVAGDRAYAAFGPELAVLDITDPFAPVRLRQVLIDNGSRALAVSGSYAFIAHGDHGLTVVDTSIPAPVASVDVLTDAQDIALKDTVAFIANGAAGMAIVDISTPAAPQLAASYPASSYTQGVAISGNRAFVTDRDGTIQVLNISNPTAPLALGFATLPGAAAGVAVVGTTAYVSWSVCDNSCETRFSTFDVSGASPVLAATRVVGTGTPGRLTVTGGYAFVTRGDGGAPHLPAGLDIYDVAAPNNPIWVNDYNTPGAYGAHDIAALGTYAYIAYGGSGFRVLNIADPTNPAVAGQIEAPADARDLIVANDLLFTTGGDGRNSSELWLLDPAAPVAPTTVGRVRLNGGPFAAGVAVADRYAYVAVPRNSGTGAVHIIDVLTPSLPSLITSIAIAAPGHVAVQDNTLFAQDGDVTLLYDVGTPLTPTLASQLPAAGALAVQNDILYVAAITDGLRLFDIADTSQPTALGSIDATWLAQDVAIESTTAFVAAGAHGVRVVDVADPNVPAVIGTYDAGWPAERVSVAFPYLYVGAGDHGIRVLEIGDPAQPVEVGYYDGTWSGGAIAVRDGVLFAAAGGDGLFGLPQRHGLAGRIVSANGTGWAGATVTATGGLATGTNALGAYGWTELAPGTVEVVPSDATHLFSPTMRTVPLPPEGRDIDFTILPATVTGTIGPAGGELIMFDTQGLTTTLRVPAGALAVTTTIAIAPAVWRAGDGLVFAGHGYYLTATGTGFGQPELTFAIPATLSVAYSAADVAGIERDSAALQWWQGEWLPAETSCTPPAAAQIDLDNGVVTTGICETGRFGLFGPPRALFLPLLFGE